MNRTELKKISELLIKMTDDRRYKATKISVRRRAIRDCAIRLAKEVGVETGVRKSGNKKTRMVNSKIW